MKFLVDIASTPAILVALIALFVSYFKKKQHLILSRVVLKLSLASLLYLAGPVLYKVH